jgi:hypothetical protein
MADANLDDLLAALREVSASSDPDSVDDEQGDELDQESDFRRRKPLGSVMLLERLEEQAEFKADEDRSLAVRRHLIPPPPTKLEQKTAKPLQMRRKVAAAENELKLNRRLEAQSKRLQKAKGQLYRANLTTRDQMELEANTAIMADWATGYCKEAGTNWREEARAAFGSQYSPPVDGRSSKQS